VSLNVWAPVVNPPGEQAGVPGRGEDIGVVVGTEVRGRRAGGTTSPSRATRCRAAPRHRCGTRRARVARSGGNTGAKGGLGQRQPCEQIERTLGHRSSRVSVGGPHLGQLQVGGLDIVVRHRWILWSRSMSWVRRTRDCRAPVHQSSAIGRRSSNRFDEGDGRWRDRSHMSAVVSPQILGAVVLDACSRGPGWRGSRSARRVAWKSKGRNASTYGRAPRIIDDRARPRIASERAFPQGSE
jgi:hypothetical protein